MNRGNIIEHNFSNYDLEYGVDNLNEKRAYNAKLPCMTKDFQSEVTIWIQAYNNFEKTKRCIESVLKYTKDVDYDLILVDNNAGDETYEYFKSLDFPKKTVIHFNKNTGSAYPFTVVPIDMISEYFVLLNNDLIVTKNWLTNLLTIIKSDKKIGVVNPSSNNASNYQNMEFQYSTYEEMQAVAERINVSDKSKWEERLRVVTLGTLIRKACLYAMGWPLFDVGFSHNFMDDDMSFRARRAGYRLIVTRDTWICHDHIQNKADKNTLMEFNRDKAKFYGKYYGIEPNEDATNNSIASMPELMDMVEKVGKGKIEILGIDVKCGMPILDIKNKFANTEEISTSAYSQEAKYYVDLSTICNTQVICDREENIKYHLAQNTYDYIVIGEPINMYNDPVRMVRDAYDLLSNGGYLIFSMKNTRNMISIITAMGYGTTYEQGIYQDIAFDDFVNILSYRGIEIEGVIGQQYENMSSEIYELIDSILDQHANKSIDIDRVKARVKTDRFWMIARKR